MGDFPHNDPIVVTWCVPAITLAVLLLVACGVPFGGATAATRAIAAVLNTIFQAAIVALGIGTYDLVQTALCDADDALAATVRMWSPLLLVLVGVQVLTSYLAIAHGGKLSIWIQLCFAFALAAACAVGDVLLHVYICTPLKSVCPAASSSCPSLSEAVRDHLCAVPLFPLQCFFCAACALVLLVAWSRPRLVHRKRAPTSSQAPRNGGVAIANIVSTPRIDPLHRTSKASSSAQTAAPRVFF